MIKNALDGSIAYVELYVSDAAPALDYFTSRFAFTPRATAADRSSRSTLLVSGSARLVVTEPRGHEGPVAEYVAAHGDAVRDIALYRDDVRAIVRRAVLAGLSLYTPPAADPVTGTLSAVLGGFGVLRHTVIERPVPGRDLGVPPGFAWRSLPAVPHGGPWPLRLIDHIAVCLPVGALEPTVAAYQYAFGMRIVRSERVEVGATAMDSHVLRDADGLTYVMAEPDPTHEPGQIDQFLQVHGAAGVQHLAFLTDDIVAAVRGYGGRGVGFVSPPPDSYYGALAARVADAPELAAQLADLRETGVLLDRDQDGELYQIFTTSPHERDALFYELVERQGSEGFGTNNIVALFEAREADLNARSATVGA
ncbi:VOC family protein [Nonomuraea longicatena]|uniref:4-hydroxyphenylpyruvate dioxygenase n=1 Tax=Nonomuraea longicatena TaxID=83682 RepID=A0ABN1NMX4_9ACTN